MPWPCQVLLGEVAGTVKLPVATHAASAAAVLDKGSARDAASTRVEGVSLFSLGVFLAHTWRALTCWSASNPLPPLLL